MSTIILQPRPTWGAVEISEIRFKCSERCSGHIVLPIDIYQWKAIIRQELDDWEARTGAKKEKVKSRHKKNVKIFGKCS